MKVEDSKIAIIGLGYVGLPLAVEFARKYPTYGFDISHSRVKELNKGIDATLEVESEDLKSVLRPNTKELGTKYGLSLTTVITDISECNVYIVTVPTPIDSYKRPDLRPLISASTTIGKVLSKGDVVIYESTTYPGCTEEDCVPVLESVSGLKFNEDFFCGYSPERINPGDKVNTLTKIIKVTSGSTPEAGKFVDNLYKSIITAGTHLAPNMRVAESSKAIENAQRDVNISFVNELALIFDRLGVDTNDVLEAAGTKWNFLNYKPGLVGGHCIGVDPYYLAHKAEQVGYHPAVILSGRRVNDNMGMFVANKVIKLMIEKGHTIKGAKALILGFTFKENCPDIRNTRVIDIYNELIQFGLDVDIHDPWASSIEVNNEYNINIREKINVGNYKAIIIAVAHNEFKSIDFKPIQAAGNSVVFDTKGYIDRELVDGRL
ncbi:MAG: nucleotide sugar dehydrogenase [Bacteroidia bacterium]|nr:nucleotide sugar dehydrogenase [Bacteroidia bacterium]